MCDGVQEAEWLREQTLQVLLRHIPKAGDYASPLADMMFFRRDKSERVVNCVYKPQVILIVQGEKSAVVAGQTVKYGTGQYLLTVVDLPAQSRCVEATPEQPFFSIMISLDKTLIDQLLMATENSKNMLDDPAALGVADVDTRLWRVIHNLTELFDTPEDVGILAPLYMKELHYRLLCGPLGGRLRHLYLPGTPSRHIAGAIAWLRENFAAPLHIKDLARRANLSESMLFRQFKKVTSLTPLQFQKQLRLQEAHRLMVSESMDANTASLCVGYESPQQFSREYKRLFGLPPLRDVTQWRAR
ncbi:MAG: AraC family transcriptional regulator [Desulfovibrionaceae bacterium]|nr:AraC family transcriptional regulator [Desulfovibrionaceae bacterium]